MIRHFTAALLASALAITAHAQLVVGQQIGVDLSTANGYTSNWTTINIFSSSVAALDFATGSAISGVTVVESTSGPGADGGFNSLGGTAVNNAITTAPSVVTTDGAWGVATSGTNTLTLTFSGLDNSLFYTLEIFSVSNTHTGVDLPVINGVTSTWATGFTTGAARYAQTTGAIFTDLSTDGAGNLSFGIADAAARNSIMNGAVLSATASAVPEPSTYAAPPASPRSVSPPCAAVALQLKRRTSAPPIAHGLEANEGIGQRRDQSFDRFDPAMSSAQMT